ncbi:hypothetical protein ACFQU7_06990 [Pseudoroseomonas wenyumeiae]
MAESSSQARCHLGRGHHRGGAAGLAVAARCLEAGRRVVLFEREVAGGSLKQSQAADALRQAAHRAALSGQPARQPVAAPAEDVLALPGTWAGGGAGQRPLHRARLP